jgi:hypothetical protein
MEYTINHRDPQAFQQAVPLAHIKAMCARAAMQPLLAPIAPLLPTILMADFIHQILDRDYMFQPGSIGRSPGGLDVLLAVTTCLPAGTGALLAGIWATGC